MNTRYKLHTNQLIGRVLKVYDEILSDPKTCWDLKASEKRDEVEKKSSSSDESRMCDFVSTLYYIHPALSFILDTDDINWRVYFDDKEIKELWEHGEPVLRGPISAELQSRIDEIEQLSGALEVYYIGRNIEHTPIDEKPFTPVNNFLECDALYYLLGLNAVKITTIITLKQRKNEYCKSIDIEFQEKLSAVEEIEPLSGLCPIDKVTGYLRYLDYDDTRETILYKSLSIELGGLDIAPTRDSTKKFEDGMLDKIPLVLKDMLAKVVNHRSTLLRKAYKMGYNINGNGIRLMDVYSSEGNIIRI
ncbi:hypothetical protein BDA99DRAFT_607881 [Phascolomyces articulosus]|uniref:Uncharacterized protein n=1 Tax=Phascolomyces articulosus TaxID=60185 RepID=A0AAD5PA97_9FUNG|nr:hypothetical protein BDA99DRAFT_607881 [Phascolomyces articulosus]